MAGREGFKAILLFMFLALCGVVGSVGAEPIGSGLGAASAGPGFHAAAGLAVSPHLDWQRRYNGPANSSDSARGIAVDADGNVYVTGSSAGARSWDDYTTIKYSPQGRQLWLRRYNGPKNDTDTANAIALDASGNVYVTGSSYGLHGLRDYATVKYDPQGRQVWVKRYNGPGNKSDDACAIAVDPDGNIVVTGQADSATGTFSMDYDVVTIKYAPNGNQLWVRRFAGPAGKNDTPQAMAIDASGKIYITGRSEGPDGTSDLMTVKYAPDGRLLWARQYDGPDHGDDYGAAIAVDGVGNVYVAGTSMDAEWHSTAVTLKYSRAGREFWARRYTGPNTAGSIANALALDPAGNPIMAGSLLTSDGNEDYNIVKYGADGVRIWEHQYDGPDSHADQAFALAVDKQGIVYATGSSGGPLMVDEVYIDDLATVACDANGTRLWAKRFDGPDHKWDSGNAIALDGTGNVYVAGRSGSTATQDDFITLKYSQRR